MSRTYMGTVKSGQGKGRDYITGLPNNDWLRCYFIAPIFPGTLAVQMRFPLTMNTEVSLLQLHSQTYYFPGFTGGYPVILKWCAKYPARFQVISTVNLRAELNLKDNSKIMLVIGDEYIATNTIKSLLYFLRNIFSVSCGGKMVRKLKRI